jgi:ceramide glucosyltransferase
VDWRGTRLRVLPGTRLVPVQAPAPAEFAPAGTDAGEELAAG